MCGFISSLNAWCDSVSSLSFAFFTNTCSAMQWLHIPFPLTGILFYFATPDIRWTTAHDSPARVSTPSVPQLFLQHFIWFYHLSSFCSQLFIFYYFTFCRKRPQCPLSFIDISTWFVTIFVPPRNPCSLNAAVKSIHDNPAVLISNLVGHSNTVIHIYPSIPPKYFHCGLSFCYPTEGCEHCNLPPT